MSNLKEEYKNKNNIKSRTGIKTTICAWYEKIKFHMILIKLSFYLIIFTLKFHFSVYILKNSYKNKKSLRLLLKILADNTVKFDRWIDF